MIALQTSFHQSNHVVAAANPLFDGNHDDGEDNGKNNDGEKSTDSYITDSSRVTRLHFLNPTKESRHGNPSHKIKWVC